LNQPQEEREEGGTRRAEWKLALVRVNGERGRGRCDLERKRERELSDVIRARPRSTYIQISKFKNKKNL